MRSPPKMDPLIVCIHLDWQLLSWLFMLTFSIVNAIVDSMLEFTVFSQKFNLLCPSSWLKAAIPSRQLYSSVHIPPSAFFLTHYILYCDPVHELCHKMLVWCVFSLHEMARQVMMWWADVHHIKRCKILGWILGLLPKCANCPAVDS